MQRLHSLLAFARRALLTALLTSIFVATFPWLLLLAPARAPRLLRRFLEWSGGAFAKLGQILAMRFDILPVAYCLELGSILDAMRPMTAAAVRKVIEQEFPGAFAQRFSRFEDQPLGSASIAQVHGAELADGTRVVVKVMRPGVEGRIRADLRCLSWWAQLFEFAGFWKGVDLTGLVAEVERLTKEELDFRLEALNAELLQRLLASDGVDHRAPKPVFAHSGRRVLTLERLSGVPLTELVRAISEGDGAALAAWEQRGIRPERLGRILFRSMLEQFYRHRVFHGDPHAGNLIALDGGALGYVDFGNVGRLDEDACARQAQIIRSLIDGRVHAAYQALLGTLEPLAAGDLRDFESAVKNEYGLYLTRVGSAHATVAERAIGGVFLRVANAIRCAGLQLPKGLMQFYRAQLVFDVLALQLHPQLDIASEYGTFLREERCRRLEGALSDLVRQPSQMLAEMLLGLPEASRQVQDWLRFRLPRLGQSYAHVFSRLERAVQLSLQYLRRGLLLLGMAALILRLGWVLGWPWAKDPVWPEPLHARWLLVAGCSFLAWHLIRRLEYRLEDPD